MRIAVYGGSFNPPHMGHVEAGAAAMEQLSPDKLMFIPTCLPPHKSQPEESPDAQTRFDLTRLAAENIPGCEASDIELVRGGKSYTADTVEELLARFPGAEIILLMGTDMFLCIESWHRHEWLLENAGLAVFPRAKGQEELIASQGERLAGRYKTKIHYINKIPRDLTSTEIRELLKKREGVDELPENVYAEIIRKRLYGAKVNFEWLRARADEMLLPARIPHVRGCESEAVKLAKRYGEDENEAAVAGILHDITKKLKPEEQLLLCEKYGILNDNVETAYPKLLHPKTGAAVARDLFGVSDEVYDAIFWHTTGRADMTMLEKIIYVADYIEPNRSIEDIDKLRELAYEDIDKAMRLGLEMSLEGILDSGAEPHKNTLEALDWFSHRRER